MLRSLKNRIVKTVFDNSKLLSMKIAIENFRQYILSKEQRFSQAISMVKTLNFQELFYQSIPLENVFEPGAKNF